MPEELSQPERELIELRTAVLDDWLSVTGHATSALSQMENSLSWRITKPLRLTRRLASKTKEVGFLAAVELVATTVAERVGRRA